MVTVLRTIPPIAVQEKRVGEMSGGDCPPYDTSHSSKGELERCQVVTVLRTIPPIAVQEKRLGEMSGGECPPYDTSHSSKGEESGRYVRW